MHFYFRLAEPLANWTLWTAIQRGLAAQLGGDPGVHDWPRIMRLPGFVNWKYGGRPLARIVEADADRVYGLCEFEALVGDNRESPSTVPGGDTTGSPSSSAERFELLARAARYARTWPSVPEKGQGDIEGRNSAAVHHAAQLTHDFGLTDEEAWPILTAWNAGNTPPLDETELRGCLRNGRKYGKQPVGCKAGSPGAIMVPDGLSIEDPWPDPPGDDAFHGPAGEVVRTIEPHSESDPMALLVQFLVGFGNIVGRRPHFLAEADQHYTNLFVILVGRTSKGRKGVAWGHVRSLFHGVDADWSEGRVFGGLSSGKGPIWCVRDPIMKREPIRESNPRRVVGYEEVEVDPGESDKRAMIFEPELASPLKVVGREGNTLSPTIRQAWDTGMLRSLTKNSPARATGAHISIIGHVTRDELRRQIAATELANGFVNRFLWLCVRRSKCLPEGGTCTKWTSDRWSGGSRPQSSSLGALGEWIATLRPGSCGCQSTPHCPKASWGCWGRLRPVPRRRCCGCRVSTRCWIDHPSSGLGIYKRPWRSGAMPNGRLATPSGRPWVIQSPTRFSGRSSRPPLAYAERRSATSSGGTNGRWKSTGRWPPSPSTDWPGGPGRRLVGVRLSGGLPPSRPARKAR